LQDLLHIAFSAAVVAIIVVSLLIHMLDYSVFGGSVVFGAHLLPFKVKSARGITDKPCELLTAD
jgi:hypothetical protein